MAKLSLKTVICSSALLALSFSKQTLSVNIPKPVRRVPTVMQPKPYAHGVPAKQKIQAAQR